MRSSLENKEGIQKIGSVWSPAAKLNLKTLRVYNFPPHLFQDDHQRCPIVEQGTSRQKKLIAIAGDGR